MRVNPHKRCYREPSSSVGNPGGARPPYPGNRKECPAARRGEARFEPSSYGFRPGRGGHDKVERIYSLSTPNKRRKWMVDADLTGATDNIHHETILDAVSGFAARQLIKAWLKAGVMEKGTLPGHRTRHTTRWNHWPPAGKCRASRNRKGARGDRQEEQAVPRDFQPPRDAPIRRRPRGDFHRIRSGRAGGREHHCAMAGGAGSSLNEEKTAIRPITAGASTSWGSTCGSTRLARRGPGTSSSSTLAMPR
ncbi:hypothetical protein NKDENANG_01580 [Candidatus Entotheonellaceae bacterium PAL068K]